MVELDEQCAVPCRMLPSTSVIKCCERGARLNELRLSQYMRYLCHFTSDASLWCRANQSICEALKRTHT